MDDLRELVDGVEHAVDAHTDDRVLAPWLDVHVARALIERVVQEVLDGRHDMAVAGLDLVDSIQLYVPLEVADVDAGGRLQFGRVHRATETVEVGDEALNIARRGHHEARLATHVRLQRFDQRVIERVGDGHRHRPVVCGDHEGSVAAREGPREELRSELGVDLEGVEVQEGEPDVLGERLHHRPFAERKARVSRLPEPEGSDDLRRMHGVATAACTEAPLARACGALPQQASVCDIALRADIAALVGCQQARLRQHVAEVLERQRGVLVGGARGHPACSRYRVAANEKNRTTRHTFSLPRDVREG